MGSAIECTGTRETGYQLLIVWAMVRSIDVAYWQILFSSSGSGCQVPLAAGIANLQGIGVDAPDLNSEGGKVWPGETPPS